MRMTTPRRYLPGIGRLLGVSVLLSVATAQVSCSRNLLNAIAPSALDSVGFTLAVIPDTQCYTSEGGNDQPAACGEPRGAITNEMFMEQARFIASSRTATRMAAVVGVGDVVNCGQAVFEWENAKRAYDVIDATGLPYAVAIGNHDYDSWCSSGFTSRSAVNYNAYFGAARFAGKTWYGDHFPAGSNENLFIPFQVQANSYGVLVLEYLPRDTVLAWAGQVLQANRSSRIIVVLHSHLDRNGVQRVSTTVDNDGASVWSKLLRPYDNIIRVLSGHDATARRVDIGDAGNELPQIQSNYQFDEAGGHGYMRMLHIRPDVQQIDVTTYSPYLRRARTDLANEFSVNYGVPPQALAGRSFFRNGR
jgi:hypothetical protein